MSDEEEFKITEEQQEILWYFYQNSSNPNGYNDALEVLNGLDDSDLEIVFVELTELYNNYIDAPTSTHYEDGSPELSLFDEVINRFFGEGNLIETLTLKEGNSEDLLNEYKASPEYQESKAAEEIAASLTQPTLGTFDPEKVREGFIPKGEEATIPATSIGARPETQIVYATPEEEELAALTADRDEVFIQQEVGQLIATLKRVNPKELELMAIEFAQAGLYDRYGGYEGIFFEVGDGLVLDERVFALVLQDAFQIAMFTKPAGDITESQTPDGVAVHAAGQFGIGLSKMFDIMTGQSGLSAQEIHD